MSYLQVPDLLCQVIKTKGHLPELPVDSLLVAVVGKSDNAGPRAEGLSRKAHIVYISYTVVERKAEHEQDTCVSEISAGMRASATGR